MNEVLYGFDYLTYYFYLLYYKFIGYPLVLRFCIAIVILCVICYFFLAIYLVYGIFHRRREKRNYERIYRRYYEPMKSVLSDPVQRKVEEIAQTVGHDIKKRLKYSEMRFLVRVLSEIRSEVGGGNYYNLQGIQGVFKIGSFFEHEIQFGRSRYKVQALLGIQAINGYVSEAVLVRFLYHRRMELRNAARFAYMWLSQNNPFRFFDEDTTMKLDRWEMAEIHSILQHRENVGFVIPNFMKWVTNSVEENVKIFFVNEIKHFNERENCAQLVEMLNTKNWMLRREIIQTLGEMKYIETESQLFEIYEVQPEYIKQSILMAIAEIKSGGGVEFLSSAYENADDQTTKLLALKGLYEYNREGREVFDRLETIAKGFSKKLFAHVRHPLTNGV